VRWLTSLVRLGQAHAGLALLATSALGLSACGVAHSHASVGTGGDSSQTDSTHTLTANTNGHCHDVADPKPKGPQHIAKPKLKLDPARSYTVQLETNCGLIDIRLASRRAPQIAASFAYLVKRGFYDDLTFHLVLSGSLIQGGDPDGNGSGGPGYQIVERPPADLRYSPGTVAMAKTATDPAGASGSQFFIVVGKKLDLPPQYALLGKVVGGWDTVTAISHVPTESDDDDPDNSPASPVVISRAILSSN
jgi:peptidyl-prolyl cis-trans isomerase B (cyclophilin B)